MRSARARALVEVRADADGQLTDQVHTAARHRVVLGAKQAAGKLPGAELTTWGCKHTPFGLIARESHDEIPREPRQRRLLGKRLSSRCGGCHDECDTRRDPQHD